jgi:hypothetical protein
MAEEQGSEQVPAQPESLAQTLEGFDMDVNPATGEFEFFPAAQPSAVEGAAPQASQPVGGETPAQAVDGQEQQTAPPAGNDPATLEKRLNAKLEESASSYSVLEARVDAVMDRLNTAASAPQQGEVPVDDSEFPAFETPQQLKAYLDSQVEARAQELIKQHLPEGIQQMTQDYEVRLELQQAVEKYGQAFVKHADEVRQVINTYPQMSFSQAFELVQSLKGGEGNSSQAPNPQTPEGTIPPTAQGAPATTVGEAIDQQVDGKQIADAALEARAQRMANVEHPTSGSGLGKPPIKSPRDAIAAALEELNMS